MKSNYSVGSSLLFVKITRGQWGSFLLCELAIKAPNEVFGNLSMIKYQLSCKEIIMCEILNWYQLYTFIFIIIIIKDWLENARSIASPKLCYNALILIFHSQPLEYFTIYFYLFNSNNKLILIFYLFQVIKPSSLLSWLKYVYVWVRSINL